jgi:hypothetical protein
MAIVKYGVYRISIHLLRWDVVLGGDAVMRIYAIVILSLAL